MHWMFDACNRALLQNHAMGMACACKVSASVSLGLRGDSVQLARRWVAKFAQDVGDACQVVVRQSVNATIASNMLVILARSHCVRMIAMGTACAGTEELVPNAFAINFGISRIVHLQRCAR